MMVNYKELLGFSPKQLKSWKSLVTLLNLPCDPSILAYTRIAYGILMMIDIPRERGMVHAYSKYGDAMNDTCRFPLFDALKPLNGDQMILLYGILFISAFGICLGMFYRLSTLCFALVYWFFFFLDKSTWNNHSYLYGLLSIILLLSDAHRYMSVDGILKPSLRNSHVPLWNYTLLRFQIFLVYFYAGLKKTDSDWLMGYSMGRLSKHWVFDPLRLVMDDATMDYLVVHIGGFTLDISVGFILFFNKTRWLGYFMCLTFHGMNSQIFRIGMFPYAMIATMFVFCDGDEFKKILRRIPIVCDLFETKYSQTNSNCVYVQKESKPNIRWRHTLVTFLTLGYISEQLFLPYSHFITKGYNGWTEGPYGYSWDMMVHSFVNQHIKITFKDKYGEEGFLKPGVFLPSSKNRWSLHPDMTIQYARCLKKNLQQLGVEEPSVYFDVWKSLNNRFQQRVFNPSVDLANYDWSPFKQPTFVLPVLTELSPWRTKLQTLKKEFKNKTMNVVFVADFPGMQLENFLEKDFGESQLEVLKGEIEVKLDSKPGNNLKAGESMKLPAGEFHVVKTVSSYPSCFFYLYGNQTETKIREKIQLLRNKNEATKIVEGIPQSSSSTSEPDDVIVMERFARQEEQRAIKRKWEESGFLLKIFAFSQKHFGIFRKSFLMTLHSARNVVIGRPDTSQLNKEFDYVMSWDDVIKYKQLSTTDLKKQKSEL